MGCHLLIELSRHSKRDFFGVLLSFLLMSCQWGGDYFTEVSKLKKGSLEDNFCVH